MRMKIFQAAVGLLELSEKNARKKICRDLQKYRIAMC